MAELNFETGLVTYTINGKCDVVFNPTDSNFVERLYSAFEDLDRKQEGYKAQIERMADKKEIFGFARERDKEMQRWIARLECEESSWSNYEKLAVLYALQKREEPNPKVSAPAVAAYSEAASNVADLVGDYGDSDFLRAVSGTDQARAWAIMDELMDSLRVVNERVYNSVMRKLA